jgi:hypothetical protein
MQRDGDMTTLSGVVVSQLGTAEQLLLWALRQRRADSGATTPELVQGFLLACGLAGVEPALGSFERLFDTLQHHGECSLGPLRCAVVSRDEATCLALLAAAQQGQSLRPGRLAAELVGPTRAPALIADAQRLADALTRAGHRLAPPLRQQPATPTVH